MAFLNPLLLGGMAAVAVPLIIHLLHRSRYRVVKWGAMHLLAEVIRTQRRRLRLEQLLLLLVRMSIPVLLALCLARPVFTAGSVLWGSAKVSLVIAFDNSMSMNAVPGVRSNLAQAREEAERIIDRLERGSEAALIMMAAKVSGEPRPTFDLAAVRRQVQSIGEGNGFADPAAALTCANGLFAHMTHAARELVVISDFQRASWGEGGAAGRQTAMAALRQLAVPPRLTLFRVGKEARDNVAVDPLDLSRQVLGIGQRLRVRANVRNRGNADYPNLRVFFRVDGKETSAMQIALGPNQERQVLFSHVFAQPGSHVLEVEADADALKADNRSLASVWVWEKLPVLLLNGEPAATPLKNETGFLLLALWPFGAAQIAQTDLMAPTVVEGMGWDPKVLARYRVIVAANVQRFQEEQAKALEQFVRDGGGLLIFVGDRMDCQWWNDRLASLLPARLGAVKGGQRDNDMAVAMQHFTHPALSMFNDPREGRLDSGRIRLWRQMKPQLTEPPVSALARLQNGEPFLLERRCGAGRVIVCATTADTDWNDLPLEPCYVPFVQQMVVYLASTVYPPRNVEIGQKLTAFLPAEEAGKLAILTDPGGKQHDLPVQPQEAKAVVEYSETTLPGLYILRAPHGETAHFVVRTPIAESDLGLLHNNEFKRLAKELTADMASSTEEYRSLQQQRRYGIEIWQPLLWLVALLMLLETWLAGRFAERGA